MSIDLRGVMQNGGTILTEEVTVIEEVLIERESWWSRLSRWSLYLAIALTPVLFSPATAPAVFFRQLVLAMLVGASLIFWLAECLMTSRFRYRTSLINSALGLALLGVMVSALFSPHILRSLSGFDPVGERVVSLLVFAVLYIVLASTFGGSLVTRAFTWLGLGGLVLSLLTLAQLLFPKVLPSVIQGIAVNPIGTVNALGVVLGLYFVLSLGVLLGARVRQKLLIKLMWAALLLLSFVDLAIINFSTIWIGIGIGVMVLLGYQFIRRDEAGRLRISAGRFLGLFVALAIAVFFVLFSPSLVRISNLPLEVSPSLAASLSIAKKSLTTHPLVGFGPGNFVQAYNAFLDPSVNQTPFWAVRFNTAAGFLLTLLVTTGIIGALTMLIFLVTVVVSIFRKTASNPENAWLYGGSAALIYTIVIWLMYSSSFTLGVLFFSLLGLLVAAGVNEKGASRFDIGERLVVFKMPWAVFSSSLLMIFVMVATLAYIYFVGEAFTGTVRAATAATRAGVGDGEGAVQNFLLAIKNDPTNDQYYRALASAELLRVQKIVSEINAGNTSLQQTFQTTVSDAINAGKRAIEINSKDPNNWAALGLVYQSIVPFIQGAENLSISSYEEAAKLDPLNPSYPFSEANTHLALADRVAAFIGRTTDEAAKNALSKQRSDAIEAARQMLEKSISLKSDLAESNYLLAQVLIQQGNLTRAIAQVEAVKRLAPTDIGVAFQLGVLYYQSSDLAKAEAELTRATGLSENYSNARYFLGLVYDREGHHEQAISEFERIQALNPDNQEVKTILANLRAGKPALATITPPPTQRRTPPVSDAAKTGSKK